MIKDFHLQKLDLTHVQTLVRWAKDEGWNPGPHDAEAFYAADPDGFYGYIIKGELMAGGSIVSYNGKFGFMGFFIVKPEYRGKGIGQKLWFERRDKLIERLDQGAVIGMDGVVTMQPFYQRGGFKIAFRDVRYACQGSNQIVDPYISAIQAEDYPLIREMDTLCFGYDRWPFLSAWLKLPNLRAFKMVINKRLLGFALLRKAVEGYKICPLFAEDYCVAHELFKACLIAADGEIIYLDVPEVNHAAITMAEKHGGEPVFECARMYYGKIPNLPVEKVFGITTFELG